MSLAANVAAAPSLDSRSVLVAGRPPVALLLAVELLAHRPAPASAGAAETAPAGPIPTADLDETTESPAVLAAAPAASAQTPTAAETDAHASQPLSTLARPVRGPGRSGNGIRKRSCGHTTSANASPAAPQRRRTRPGRGHQQLRPDCACSLAPRWPTNQ